ncbi:hypothetical protein JCM8202v2_000144 [Rhodotorula sphaerocarpa]
MALPDRMAEIAAAEAHLNPAATEDDAASTASTASVLENASMAVGTFFGQTPRQSYLPHQPHLQQPAQSQQQQPYKRQTGNFSNAFLNPHVNNGQPHDPSRHSVYAPSVRPSLAPGGSSSSHSRPQSRQSSILLLDPQQRQQHKIRLQEFQYEQQQNRTNPALLAQPTFHAFAYDRAANAPASGLAPPPPPSHAQTALRPGYPPSSHATGSGASANSASRSPSPAPPTDRPTSVAAPAPLHLFPGASRPSYESSSESPAVSPMAASPVASSPTVLSSSVSPQLHSDEKHPMIASIDYSPAAVRPAPPTRPSTQLCKPFDLDEWTITDTMLPRVVSPAQFLLWQTSPLAGRDAFETVFVDAQTRRVAFVAREYVRGKDGVLRRGGVEDEDTRETNTQWHESDGSGGARSTVERLEWLLLSVPSPRERQRGSDQLAKVGLVTNDNLYLPAGKVVRWKKFYHKSFFADEKDEPTWQGVGGTKYRWVVPEGNSGMCYLIDHRSKEVVVTVRERTDKPTQVVISALVQSSLQPVLLTLLHRTFTIYQQERNKDLQAWEQEEVVRW